MSPRAGGGSVDRRGAAILAWVLAGAVYALGLSEVGGLKYLQDVTWPTALYTFQRLEPEPVKVAIVGTSRSSFGLVPTVIDPCLRRRLGEPARSVNLSRVFASILTEAILVRTLFEDDLPAHLLVEVAPEIVNSDHHEMALNMAWNADLRDVPACL